MSGVIVRELAGWGLDDSARREAAVGAEAVRARRLAAEARVAGRRSICVWDALAEGATRAAAERLRREMGREDLREEMEGLAWEVGMVEMERLVAFQRRLVLKERAGASDLDSAFRRRQGRGDGEEDGCDLEDRSGGGGMDGDLEGLMGVAFGPPRVAAYEVWVEDGGVGLRSENPDLRLRITADGGLVVDGGSPFLEVAESRGRWFLRDGYHRAYGLLRAGVRCVPAVIVRARSMAEMGAGAARFFGEAEMFSERPPMVVDFLDDELCLEYEQPRLVKRMGVRVEEWMEEAEVEGVRG